MEDTIPPVYWVHHEEEGSHALSSPSLTSSTIASFPPSAILKKTAGRDLQHEHFAKYYGKRWRNDGGVAGEGCSTSAWKSSSHGADHHRHNFSFVLTPPSSSSDHCEDDDEGKEEKEKEEDAASRNGDDFFPEGSRREKVEVDNNGDHHHHHHTTARRGGRGTPEGGSLLRHDPLTPIRISTTTPIGAIPSSSSSRGGYTFHGTPPHPRVVSLRLPSLPPPSSFSSTTPTAASALPPVLREESEMQSLAPSSHNGGRGGGGLGVDGSGGDDTNLLLDKRNYQSLLPLSNRSVNARCLHRDWKQGREALALSSSSFGCLPPPPPSSLLPPSPSPSPSLERRPFFRHSPPVHRSGSRLPPPSPSSINDYSRIATAEPSPSPFGTTAPAEMKIFSPSPPSPSPCRSTSSFLCSSLERKRRGETTEMLREEEGFRLKRRNWRTPTSSSSSLSPPIAVTAKEVTEESRPQRDVFIRAELEKNEGKEYPPRVQGGEGEEELIRVLVEKTTATASIQDEAGGDEGGEINMKRFPTRSGGLSVTLPLSTSQVGGPPAAVASPLLSHSTSSCFATTPPTAVSPPSSWSPGAFSSSSSSPVPSFSTLSLLRSPSFIHIRPSGRRRSGRTVPSWSGNEGKKRREIVWRRERLHAEEQKVEDERENTTSPLRVHSLALPGGLDKRVFPSSSSFSQDPTILLFDSSWRELRDIAEPLSLFSSFTATIHSTTSSSSSDALKTYEKRRDGKEKSIMAVGTGEEERHSMKGESSGDASGVETHQGSGGLKSTRQRRQRYTQPPPSPPSAQSPSSSPMEKTPSPFLVPKPTSSVPSANPPSVMTMKRENQGNNEEEEKKEKKKANVQENKEKKENSGRHEKEQSKDLRSRHHHHQDPHEDSSRRGHTPVVVTSTTTSASACSPTRGASAGKVEEKNGEMPKISSWRDGAVSPCNTPRRWMEWEMEKKNKQEEKRKMRREGDEKEAAATPLIERQVPMMKKDKGERTSPIMTAPSPPPPRPSPHPYFCKTPHEENPPTPMEKTTISAVKDEKAVTIIEKNEKEEHKQQEEQQKPEKGTTGILDSTSAFQEAFSFHVSSSPPSRVEERERKEESEEEVRKEKGHYSRRRQTEDEERNKGKEEKYFSRRFSSSRTASPTKGKDGKIWSSKKDAFTTTSTEKTRNRKTPPHFPSESSFPMTSDVRAYYPPPPQAAPPASSSTPSSGTPKREEKRKVGVNATIRRTRESPLDRSSGVFFFPPGSKGWERMLLRCETGRQGGGGSPLHAFPIQRARGYNNNNNNNNEGRGIHGQRHQRPYPPLLHHQHYALLSSLHHSDRMTEWERIQREIKRMQSGRKTWGFSTAVYRSRNNPVETLGEADEDNNSNVDEEEDESVPLCYAASRQVDVEDEEEAAAFFFSSSSFWPFTPGRSGGRMSTLQYSNRSRRGRGRGMEWGLFPLALGNVDRAIHRLSKKISLLFRSPYSTCGTKGVGGKCNRERTEVEVAVGCAAYRLDYVDDLFLPTLLHVFGVDGKYLLEQKGKRGWSMRIGQSAYPPPPPFTTRRSTWGRRQLRCFHDGELTEEEEEEDEVGEKSRLRELEWKRLQRIMSGWLGYGSLSREERQDEKEEEKLLWRLRERRLERIDYKFRIREREGRQLRYEASLQELQQVLCVTGAIFYLRLPHVLPFLTGGGTGGSSSSASPTLLPPPLPAICFPDGTNSIRPFGFHVGRYLHNGELVAGLGALAEACGAVLSIFSSNAPVGMCILPHPHRMMSRSTSATSTPHSSSSISPQHGDPHRRERERRKGAKDKIGRKRKYSRGAELKRDGKEGEGVGDMVLVSNPPIILVWANPFGMWELVSVDTFFPCVVVASQMEGEEEGGEERRRGEDGFSPPRCSSPLAPTSNPSAAPLRPYSKKRGRRELLGCFAWGPPLRGDEVEEEEEVCKKTTTTGTKDGEEHHGRSGSPSHSLYPPPHSSSSARQGGEKTRERRDEVWRGKHQEDRSTSKQILSSSPRASPPYYRERSSRTPPPQPQQKEEKNRKTKKRRNIVFWPSACEKALAKLFGSYTSTCKLSAARCVSCFTGGPVEQWRWWRADPGAALLDMESALHYQNVRGNTIILLHTRDGEADTEEESGVATATATARGGRGEASVCSSSSRPSLPSVADTLRAVGLRLGTSYRVLAVSTPASTCTRAASALFPLASDAVWENPDRTTITETAGVPDTEGGDTAFAGGANEKEKRNHREHAMKSGGEEVLLPSLPQGPQLLLRIWHDGDEDEEEYRQHSPPHALRSDSHPISASYSTTSHLYSTLNGTAVDCRAQSPPPTAMGATSSRKNAGHPLPTTKVTPHPDEHTDSSRTHRNRSSVWVDYQNVVLRCFDTCHACFDCRRFHDIRMAFPFHSSETGREGWRRMEKSTPSPVSSPPLRGTHPSPSTSSLSHHRQCGSFSHCSPSASHRHRRGHSSEVYASKERETVKRTTSTREEEEGNTSEMRKEGRKEEVEKGRIDGYSRDLFVPSSLPSSFFLSPLSASSSHPSPTPLVPLYVLRVRLLARGDESGRVEPQEGDVRNRCTTRTRRNVKNSPPSSVGEPSAGRLWIGLHQPHHADTHSRLPSPLRRPCHHHPHGYYDDGDRPNRMGVDSELKNRDGSGDEKSDYLKDEQFGLRLTLIHRRGEEEMQKAIRRVKKAEEEEEEEGSISSESSKGGRHHDESSKGGRGSWDEDPGSVLPNYCLPPRLPATHPHRRPRPRLPSQYAILSESYGGRYRVLPSVWMYLELNRPPPLSSSSSSPLSLWSSSSSSFFTSSSHDHEMKAPRITGSSRSSPCTKCAGYTEFYIVPQLMEMTLEEEQQQASIGKSTQKRSSSVRHSFSHSTRSTSPAFQPSPMFSSATSVMSLLSPTPSAFQVDLLAAPPELAAAIHLQQLDSVEYDQCVLLSSGDGGSSGTATGDGGGGGNSEEHFIQSQVNGNWEKGFHW